MDLQSIGISHGSQNFCYRTRVRGQVSSIHALTSRMGSSSCAMKSCLPPVQAPQRHEQQTSDISSTLNSIMGIRTCNFCRASRTRGWRRETCICTQTSPLGAQICCSGTQFLEAGPKWDETSRGAPSTALDALPAPMTPKELTTTPGSSALPVTKMETQSLRQKRRASSALLDELLNQLLVLVHTALESPD